MADQNKKQYIKYENTTYIIEDHRLPDPSSADNGKVLGIVNGAYVLKQEQGGGEGTVKSVNNIEPDANGDVALGASDVHALPDSTVIPTVPQMATKANMSDWTSGKTVDAATLKECFNAEFEVHTALNSDIEALQAAKYTKPSGGIPASDLAADVQTSLGKADTAYQKPSGGIPASDLASGVIPVVPQMATQAGMSDWTSGKTVDAATLKTNFIGALTLLSEKADISDIPTAVSELTNDSGFQTAAQVQSAIAAIPDELPDTTSASANDFLCLNAQKQPIWKTVPPAESNSFGGGA